jgi:methylthioribose-1-phosphate isomerase
MKIDGRHYRTLWVAADGWTVEVIDQTLLPHRLEIVRLATVDQAAEAIRHMTVRGAPLIGVTAAYGLALAMRADPSDRALREAAQTLGATRPTAVNLRAAIDAMSAELSRVDPERRASMAYANAGRLADDDVATSRAIAEHGLPLIRKSRAGAGPVNVLTHCNAGWLATIDWGTALAPVYLAHERGLDVHVWVDETRPRNQGAALTAWELGKAGVAHTLVVDNAGGHLMQHGLVDLCIVGTDRTTAGGDVANKIGTYLKALAARDNDVPFYVAAPSSSIDWAIEHGASVPIEERQGEEVSHVTGEADDGRSARVRVTPRGTPVKNYAFDVTPGRLVTAIVTERGVCAASREGLQSLFPEHANQRPS